jgi:hypothetical protein
LDGVAPLAAGSGTLGVYPHQGVISLRGPLLAPERYAKPLICLPILPADP